MARLKFPLDWEVIFISEIGKETTKSQKGKIELIELNPSTNGKHILLMLPGFFQNAFGFDLLPEQQISIARYLSEKFNFHIFFLHPNGIGHSDYVKGSQIDEYAYRDVSAAVYFIHRQYQKPIYVFGHSTGAIALQVFLGGLVVKNNQVVFDEGISKLRQAKVKAVILSAGNVCMTVDDEKAKIKKLSRFGNKIRSILKSIGWINARLLTRFISPVFLGSASMAYSSKWDFLYHKPNVSKEAQAALYSKSLDGTSGKMVLQFSLGVIENCLVSRSDTKYNLGLANITVPVCQLVYDLDPLAPPIPTERDNFSKISSIDKKFFQFKNQGHEDFMMNKQFHQNLDAPVAFLLSLNENPA